MRKQLQVLLEIQNLENQKREILKQRNSTNSEAIRALWEDICILKNKVIQEKANLETNQRKYKDLDSNLSNLIEQSGQLESKLYSGSIKNLKEIEQVQSKCDSVKAHISVSEDEALAVIEQCEKLSCSINNLEDLMIAKKRKHEDNQREIIEAMANMEKDVEDINKRIVMHMSSIDESLIKKYNDLKRGLTNPVAKVIKDYCSGCRRSLPIKQIEAAKVTVICCDNCGRILLSE